MGSKGRAGRTRLDPDARRAAILECAGRLFSVQYYGNVSMEAVAQEAGVTRGLLNHYFGTKRELYLAVVREMFRRTAVPEPEYVQGTTPEDRLAESVDMWLDMTWRNRETMLGAIRADSLGGDTELQQILDQVSEAAVDGIIRVLGLGPARDAPPELRALLHSFGTMAQGATREWLERGRLSREQVHELLTTTLLWMG